MRKLIALLAIGALGAVLASVALARHSWGDYHWARTANPFTIKVVDSVTSTWDSHLDLAISDWSKSKSTVLGLTEEPGADSSRDRKQCRAISGKIRVCNANYGFNGWLGLAQIWASGSHITQGVSKMNDSYFDTETYNTPAWRQLVICQEPGHNIGLHHQDETFDNPNLGTCMDYTNDPDGGPGGASETDPSNEHPNQHDYDQLKTIYTHTDSSTTIASSSSSLPGNAPPFSQASRANGSVYVDDLGNGQRLITHVFWTPFGE